MSAPAAAPVIELKRVEREEGSKARYVRYDSGGWDSDAPIPQAKLFMSPAQAKALGNPERLHFSLAKGAVE